MIEDAIERYAEFINQRPVLFLLGVLLITGALTSGGANVDTVEQNTEDFLPDSVPAIQAFEVLEAEFSSAEATSYTVLFEISPRYADSNEVRDMRDPRFLRFSRSVSDDISKIDSVKSVSSPSQLLNDIPATKNQVIQVFERIPDSRIERFISEDYEAAKIEVEATGLTADEETELAKRIRETVRSHENPPGLEVSYTGQTYIDEAFQRESRQTTSLTTLVAFTGVLLVVIMLFRSIYYGLTSMLTLLFGIAAGFGVFGLLGFNLSPATSGAISIGVGIAIDFGIQPVARYREEREELGIEEALETTLKNIYRPMTLGLIGALMGFSALSTGRITFLSSLGTLLSLTTLLAYAAAFTVIPASVVIHDRYLSERIDAILKSVKNALPWYR